MKKLLTIPGGPEPFKVSVTGISASKLGWSVVRASLEPEDNGYFQVPDSMLDKIPHQTKAILIRDRARLNRVLLDAGYVPDDYGDFCKKGDGTDFLAAMWKHCGEEVIDGRLRGCDILPEWTEEVEVEG